MEVREARVDRREELRVWVGSGAGVWYMIDGLILILVFGKGVGWVSRQGKRSNTSYWQRKVEKVGMKKWHWKQCLGVSSDEMKYSSLAYNE